jgi:hypothetical protein
MDPAMYRPPRNPMQVMARDVQAERQQVGKLTPLFEVTALVFLKVLLLLALSQLFFSPTRHPHPTAADVSDHLFTNTR